MYNRYVPDSGGVYQREVVEEPKKDLPCPGPQAARPEQPDGTAPCQRQEQPRGSGGPFSMDLGDLLLLCVVLLLLVESQEEDWTSMLITAAAFVLLQ